jgi:hypothetical protein
LGREAVKWADEIIVLSHGVQEYFKKEYGRETVFIPNGVSKPEVKEADEIKKQWNLEKDSYVDKYGGTDYHKFVNNEYMRMR